LEVAMSRVLVIGLDGLSPDLVESWLPELPNITALRERGIYGRLESIIQPVTPAAWTAMISGHNPGHFGFTDFTRRQGKSPTDFRLVHSGMVRLPTLATLLPQAGRRALMIGVPVSYPPLEIAQGVCVSCFMAPSLKAGVTFPSALQAELLAQTSSPYLLDVSLAQTPQIERGELARRLKELDRQRFDIARYLMQSRPWDLLFLVCMGSDRVGHYFMRFQDPLHGRYDADARYRDVIREHYRYCDTRLGELVADAGPETVVMVVSDHGLQRLDGKVNLNDWLVAHGYLVLREPLAALTPMGKAPVDWERTRAWAHGYGGQIYLNVQGREPQGCVPPADVDSVLSELEAQLRGLCQPDGRGMQVETIRRQEIYSGPYADDCPDLFVQWEGLRYTTSDLLGHSTLVQPVQELGPDDAAHAPAGFFAMAGPAIPQAGMFAAAHLLDIAPTILDVLGLALPADLDGRPLHRVESVYSPEDEAELTSRLRTLYLE
jgi:predicted AlkP superfamily phosphohydrolase/phosphomutase